MFRKYKKLTLKVNSNYDELNKKINDIYNKFTQMIISTDSSLIEYCHKLDEFIDTETYRHEVIDSIIHKGINKKEKH